MRYPTSSPSLQLKFSDLSKTPGVRRITRAEGSHLEKLLPRQAIADYRDTKITINSKESGTETRVSMNLLSSFLCLVLAPEADSEQLTISRIS